MIVRRRTPFTAAAHGLRASAVALLVWSAMPAHASTGLPPAPNTAVAKHVKHADFARERVSRDARQMADWVVDSRNNADLPFIVIDKIDARALVFNAEGHLLGSAPALLGAALGDDSVPGIGTRKMSEIQPGERTTPAGRFVAEHGRNANGEDILWVDYDAAISLHRVRATKREERRLERLATPTPRDNRISFGCINVPAAFYDKVVIPALKGRVAIVYVLPDTRSAREVFGAYDVAPQPSNESGKTLTSARLR